MTDRYSVERRLDYIDWRMVSHGSVRRSDIVRQFGVSMSQASHDLTAYTAQYPDALRYDMQWRSWRASDGYVTLRGWTRTALAANRALARTGHPMAFRD